MIGSPKLLNRIPGVSLPRLPIRATKDPYLFLAGDLDYELIFIFEIYFLINNYNINELKFVTNYS